MDFSKEGREASTRELPDEEVHIPNRHLDLLRRLVVRLLMLPRRNTEEEAKLLMVHGGRAS
jgi:hypothetical protein